jgi:hypothetical protein
MEKYGFAGTASHVNTGIFLHIHKTSPPLY